VGGTARHLAAARTFAWLSPSPARRAPRGAVLALAAAQDPTVVGRTRRRPQRPQRCRSAAEEVRRSGMVSGRRGGAAAEPGPGGDGPLGPGV